MEGLSGPGADPAHPCPRGGEREQALLEGLGRPRLRRECSPGLSAEKALFGVGGYPWAMKPTGDATNCTVLFSYREICCPEPAGGTYEVPGMPTLTAGIGGIGAELPWSLAQACWQGHLHHQDLTQCTMTVMCPMTVIQAHLLKRKPGFQMGV